MDFREIKEHIKDISIYIIIILAVVFCVQYVTTIQQVMGPSMEPTLYEGQAILLNKLAYRIGKINRGDIVVLSHGGKFMVKRVIGLPGEKIEYKDNVLYVDGEPYKEKYLGSDVITEDFSIETLKNSESETIPKDMYLVLGDNRPNSDDCRAWGTINKKDIIGKSMIRIWPINKIGIVK